MREIKLIHSNIKRLAKTNWTVLMLISRIRSINNPNLKSCYFCHFFRPAMYYVLFHTCIDVLYFYSTDNDSTSEKECPCPDACNRVTYGSEISYTSLSELSLGSLLTEVGLCEIYILNNYYNYIESSYINIWIFSNWYTMLMIAFVK